MAWDVTTAKTVLGIDAGDTSKDVAIQQALDVVMSTVEKAVGRGLLYARETVYLPTRLRTVLLPRYPVAVVHSPAIEFMHKNGQNGIVVLANAGTEPQTVVDYEGGYDPLPVDLEQAMWEIFLFVWTTINTTTGFPSESSGGAATIVQGTGEVSRVSLADFGSISFDVGATVASSSYDITAATRAEWGWLSPWAWVLKYYRSEAAPTVAFA